MTTPTTDPVEPTLSKSIADRLKATRSRLAVEVSLGRTSVSMALTTMMLQAIRAGRDIEMAQENEGARIREVKRQTRPGGKAEPKPTRGPRRPPTAADVAATAVCQCKHNEAVRHLSRCEWCGLVVL